MTGKFDYGSSSPKLDMFRTEDSEHIQIITTDPFEKALRASKEDAIEPEKFLTSEVKIKVWRMNSSEDIREYQKIKTQAFRDGLNTKGSDPKKKIYILREETSWDKSGNYLIALTWAEILDETPDIIDTDGVENGI